MTSVVLVVPLAFGPDPQTKDNALIKSLHVSNAKADMDRAQVCTLVSELDSFFRNECGIDTAVIHHVREPKAYRGVLTDKGQSVCVADSLSLHDIVDASGVIQRRLVVFYPMSPLRRGELARKQLVNQITAVAEASSNIELVDLREYESEEKYLEGSGSLVFSPGGRYVYMAASPRSNATVLATLCSPENLNIPPENRFVLRCKAGGVPHTNVLGWCGAGICAWCIDALAFASDAEEDAFYSHLSQSYTCVLELSEAEMRAFAGSALEVPVQPVGAAAGAAHYALVISETALAALSPRNRAMLRDWYQADNIHTFYGEVLERRCGTSLPSCIAASYTHGPRPPMPQQPSTVKVLRLGEDK